MLGPNLNYDYINSTKKVNFENRCESTKRYCYNTYEEKEGKGMSIILVQCVDIVVKIWESKAYFMQECLVKQRRGRFFNDKNSCLTKKPRRFVGNSEEAHRNWM